MSRRKVSGVLITAVHTGWSEPSLTSRPSQRRKANGAGIWPNTSRRTRAAPAGLGLGSGIIRVPPRSFYRGLADLVNPSRGRVLGQLASPCLSSHFTARLALAAAVGNGHVTRSPAMLNVQRVRWAKLAP